MVSCPYPKCPVLLLHLLPTHHVQTLSLHKQSNKQTNQSLPPVGLYQLLLVFGSSIVHGGRGGACEVYLGEVEVVGAAEVDTSRTPPYTAHI